MALTVTMREAWLPHDERHRTVLVHGLRDYLNDLRRSLLDNYFRFVIIPRFLVVPLHRGRGSSARQRWWKKGLSSLADYGLCAIRGEQQPLGIRGAACCRQHFVYYLRSEWVAEFPATSRLNPSATKRAKGILVAILGKPQILSELLRKCSLALPRIHSAGR
jgi:hypothetical protein